MSTPHPRVVLWPDDPEWFRYLQCRTSSMERDSLWGWLPKFTTTKFSLIWRWSCIRAKVFVRLKFSVVISEGSSDGRPIISSASVSGLMPKFSMSPVTQNFTKRINMTVLFNQKSYTYGDCFNNDDTIHTEMTCEIN